jgi:ATP-dependent Clp protease ATP-binding subunit ClpA
MFERFTEQSRRAVVRAQEEARSFGHDYIGTEHLLAGLRAEERSAAARALDSAGVTLDAVRETIETLVGRDEKAPSGPIPFTPQAKKVLELSLRQALQLGHNHISTGHVLLGLISQDDTVAVQVLGALGALGADKQQLRVRVTRDIEDDPEVRSGFSSVRLRHAQVSGAVKDLLDTIDDRLSAIELHLGMAHPDPNAAARSEAAGVGELAELQAEAGRLQVEADRLQAEADRLRALRREHDIDPGDPGDASAAAG